MFTLVCSAGLLSHLIGLGRGATQPGQGDLEDTLNMLGSEVCLPHFQNQPLSELKQHTTVC